MKNLYAMKIFCVIGLMAFMSWGLPQSTALAAPCTSNLCVASNGNTQIAVRPESDPLAFGLGFHNWVVDGVDHSFENWFFFRSGPAGSVLPAERSLDSSLPLLSANMSGNMISLGYGDSSMAADLKYTVFGGGAGSGNSTVQTTVTLSNLGQTALDLVWFNFVDLDIDINAQTDTGVFVSPGTILQTDISTATYTSLLAPDAWFMSVTQEVREEFVNAGLGILDPNPSNLPNISSPIGPLDVGFAVQYNFLNLPGGQSIGYQTVLSLGDGVTTPEPEAWVLFVTGLFGLALWRKAKKS